LPGAVLLVLADGHDDRLFRVVDLRGDLPPEGPLEGPLEVPQRLGPGLADAAVLVAGGDDVLLAPRLDARQGQFLAKDRGHLLQRQLHFEDVAARLVTGPRLALALGGRQGLADVAVALADAAGALLAVAELRDVDLRQGDADQVLPLLADQFAPADVFAQVALHLAPDDLPEALVIAVDPLAHGNPPLRIADYGALDALPPLHSPPCHPHPPPAR